MEEKAGQACCEDVLCENDSIDWLDSIFGLLAVCDIQQTQQKKIVRDESIPKQDWIKQPRMTKIARCVVEPPPKNRKQEEYDAIQAEFSVEMARIDNHYKETKAKGEAERAAKLVDNAGREDKLRDQQIAQKIANMKCVIDHEWQNSSLSKHHITSYSPSTVWNHECDLLAAKNAACFIVKIDRDLYK